MKEEGTKMSHTHTCTNTHAHTHVHTHAFPSLNRKIGGETQPYQKIVMIKPWWHDSQSKS